MEIAWAAGLFEGEGCLAFSGGRPRLQLKMIHEDSVRRVHAAAGVGKVYGPYGPYTNQLGDKPVFMWVVDKQGEIDHVVELFRPYLTPWVVARLERKAGERVADVASAPRKPPRRRFREGEHFVP